MPHTKPGVISRAVRLDRPVRSPPVPGRAPIARTMAAQAGKNEKPFHIVSPVLESLPLSKAAGTNVYMKLENVQPTGSFKIRGIGRLCQEVSVGRTLLRPLRGAWQGDTDAPFPPSLPPFRPPRRAATTSCAPQVTRPRVGQWELWGMLLRDTGGVEG